MLGQANSSRLKTIACSKEEYSRGEYYPAEEECEMNYVFKVTGVGVDYFKVQYVVVNASCLKSIAEAHVRPYNGHKRRYAMHKSVPLT